MITALAHVCILTDDLAVSEKFYCEALGLKKQFSFIKNDELVGFYINFGNDSFIEIFKADQAPAQADNAIMKHICLQVDDIHATIERIRAKGIEVSDKKMGADQSWQAWLKEPSGMPIELHEYTEQSSQKTNADCILE
jgi:predicted enzyme related to lactoylglutathione lyase